MNAIVRTSFIVVALTLFVSASAIAKPAGQSAPPQDKAESERKTETAPSSASQQAMELSQNMDKMATTVASMDRVCEQMMKLEMANASYKFAAGVGPGVLLTVVLISACRARN